MIQNTTLPHRGVIELSGPDRVTFLNGLVSNDVSKAMPGKAIWAALLTAQGKYLADFFIFTDGERLLLETARTSIPDLLIKLHRFKLRAAVEIKDISDQLFVHALWQGEAPQAPLIAPDPRLTDAGFRLLSPSILPSTATQGDYAAHRLRLGLPDGEPDLEPGKTLLLEAGFDELNGIDWQKGCYMGQELTARTKYRGLVKRRLLPVTLGQSGLLPGAAILAKGQEVGTLRSVAGHQALAMLHLSALGQNLTVSGTPLQVHIPDWVKQSGLSDPQPI